MQAYSIAVQHWNRGCIFLSFLDGWYQQLKNIFLKNQQTNLLKTELEQDLIGSIWRSTFNSFDIIITNAFGVSKIEKHCYNVLASENLEWAIVSSSFQIDYTSSIKLE